MLQRKYKGINMPRAILSMKTTRGQRTRFIVGMRVRRRPRRSPVFQRRKARGMKHAGCRIRGAVSIGRTLVICCVKTGKNIVMLKVRNTAEAR